MTLPFSNPEPWQTLLRDFQGLLKNAGAYCFVKDAAGRYLYANASVARLFRTPSEMILGRRDEAFFDLERSAELSENDRRVLETGVEVHAEENLVLRHGEARVFWSLKLPWRDEHGNIQGLVGVASDITEARRDTERLIEHNQVLSTVLGHVDAYVYLKDHEGRYLYANAKVAELYGLSSHQILGRTDHEILLPEIASRLRQFDLAVLNEGVRIARQEVLLNSVGQERQFWSIKLPLLLPGTPPRLIGFSTDITELLELRKNLEAQRTTDPLTGLANRQRFEAELDVDLSLVARDGHALAVVLLNLDQFKYVNNSLGQDIGNQLLVEVAQRLRAQKSIKGSLTRLFGDEFAYSLPRFASTEEVAGGVDAVRLALASPYVIAGHTLNLSCSVGIALYPEDGRSCSLLISHAETAMHHAKERGRNRYQFYASAIGDALSQRLELERDLRAALQVRQFELHYQPKLRLDGRLQGLEALIRWNRPGHGPVSPALFIPLAEQLGLVDLIGAWVIEEACQQMAVWREANCGDIPVAVNLSPSQLRDPAFVDWVAGIRRQHRIADGQLEMEVTESMMMEEPEAAITALGRLRQQGIHLAIDDFGTGYSSMAYLKRIPVHTLKLDRVFIAQIDSDARDADLCAGMIALAHKLGLQVVAEGVETEAQRAALAQRDCDVFQGYLYSRPLPIAEATRFIASQRG